MKENYTYSAIVEKDGAMITVYFPAFPDLFLAVEKEEDLVETLQDMLAMKLIDLIDTKEKLPADVISEAGEGKIYFINVWLPYYRAKVKETYTKKTLTIPTWLDILAKSKNINFSSVLVKALKAELHID